MINTENGKFLKMSKVYRMYVVNRQEEDTFRGWLSEMVKMGLLK